MDKVFEVIYRQKGGLYKQQKFFGSLAKAENFAESCIDADIITHNVL